MKNPYPIHVLPKSIQKIIINKYDVDRTNIDLLASSMLTVLSTAIGNTFRVISPVGEWAQPAIMFMVLVFPMGGGKTPATKFAIAPLFKRDKIAAAAFEEAFKDWDVLRVRMEKDKDSDPKELSDHLLERPKNVVTILKDFTPESLIPVHKNNERGLLIDRDEILGFLNSFDRYSSGGEEEFYTELHNGSDVSVIRKGNVKHQDFTKSTIESAHVSMLGGIQPRLVSALFEGKKEHSGFSARMLICYPDDVTIPNVEIRVGKRSTDNADQWEDIIANALKTQIRYDLDGNINPYEIDFDEDAKHLVKAFDDANKIEANTDANATIAAYHIKMLNLSFRFAPTLHLSDVFCEKRAPSYSISYDTTKRALDLMEYHKNCWIRSLNVSKNEVDKMDDETLAIFNKLDNDFRTSTLIRLYMKGGKTESASKLAANRLLKNETLFKKEGHGKWSKRTNK